MAAVDRGPQLGGLSDSAKASRRVLGLSEELVELGPVGQGQSATRRGVVVDDRLRFGNGGISARHEERPGIGHE